MPRWLEEDPRRRARRRRHLDEAPPDAQTDRLSIDDLWAIRSVEDPQEILEQIVESKIRELNEAGREAMTHYERRANRVALEAHGQWALFRDSMETLRDATDGSRIILDQQMLWVMEPIPAEVDILKREAFLTCPGWHIRVPLGCTAARGMGSHPELHPVLRWALATALALANPGDDEELSRRILSAVCWRCVSEGRYPEDVLRFLADLQRVTPARDDRWRRRRLEEMQEQHGWCGTPDLMRRARGDLDDGCIE